MRFAFVFLFGITMANATEYFVRKDGSDSNTGLADTAGGAKLLIQAAANLTAAGDVVRVGTGTYLERVTVPTSGSAGNLITFVTNGAVVCRGFLLSNKDYIRIAGFEITADINSLNHDGIAMNTGSDFCEIIDNYIHNTDGYPISIVNCNDGIIRGNRIEYGHKPPGGPANGDALISYNTSHRWMIEYNRLNFGGDFLNSSGSNYVYRNCRLGPVQSTATDFPDWPGEHHIDVSQDSQDSPDHVLEAHWYTGHPTDINSDAHFTLHQRPNSDRHRTRGNVSIRQGAGSQAYRQADNNRHYHNSYVDGNLFSPTDNQFHFTGEADGNVSTGNESRLNIHDHVCDTGVYFIDTGASLTYDWDVNFNSGSQTQVNGLANTDPLFVARASDNLRLQSGSPARISGNLTLANGSGSGSTTLIVDDASWFVDTMGVPTMVADSITIGAGALVLISSISGNTITLSEARTWSDNDPVRWRGQSDAGAFPFSMTPLTAATYSNVGGTVTVTPAGDARKVIKYRAGIPVATDEAAPFSIADHQAGDSYVVCALYASDTLTVIAAEAGAAGDGIYRNKGRSTRSAGIIP